MFDLIRSIAGSRVAQPEILVAATHSSDGDEMIRVRNIGNGSAHDIRIVHEQTREMLAQTRDLPVGESVTLPADLVRPQPQHLTVTLSYRDAGGRPVRRVEEIRFGRGPRPEAHHASH